MDEKIDPTAELAAYGAAARTLNGWIEGAQALALLDAALASGILDAARTPRSPDQIAALVGLDEGRVADLCLALDAHGVLDAADGTYRLAPDFATLAAPDAPTPLAAILASGEAIARFLSRAAAPDRGYADLSPDEMLAVARGVTVRPGAPLGLAAVAEVYALFPEVAAIWERGGRHVEVGCGIGGGVLNTLALYPRLLAVGVDREGAPLAEARAAAASLGVADRVEFRQVDARDLDEAAAFDTAFWSQFFFPAGSRAATLAAVWRALKPGGYLAMPLLSPPPPPGSLRGEGGRRHARVRLLYGGWGVPVLTAEELRAEAEGAGFAFVRAMATPMFRGLLMRRAANGSDRDAGA